MCSSDLKAVGGGLPVEIWARFMRAAHQGVPVASLPTSQVPGFFATIAQGPQLTASQITAPSAAPASASLAPYPVPGPNRPAPARTNPSARPEAAAGLDGWLMQRLFGGR